ncbi:hypothetical protein B5F11_20535 [Anaerotruncus colihominis]|uniref:Uncharacterized protein n=1 Tax=Anaerotruncus colihominis TaxID=169435 RepID=A0A1Y4M3D0_9FIRM|nr:hypothetical protein [Anaerotruncus colihominis]OUP63355.1 hypothetical protein B5F11_20535 [Anaerotruncus colihominis]
MNEKIIWKKSVRRALICGLICAVLISGCGNKNDEAPSSYTAYKSEAQSVSPTISSTSYPESDISNPASEFQKRLEPVQLKLLTELGGENLLKIYADGERTELKTWDGMRFFFDEVCNGTFKGVIYKYGERGEGDFLYEFHQMVAKLPNRSSYFITDNLICSVGTDGSIALLNSRGIPLDVIFQFDFGVRKDLSPELFADYLGEWNPPPHEYYPFGISYDEAKQEIIMCYKRSELMLDKQQEAGIAVFDLYGNLLMNILIPKEYYRDIYEKFQQIHINSFLPVERFQRLPIEGRPLLIPTYNTYLLFYIEQQTWKSVNDEMAHKLLQGSGWRLEQNSEGMYDLLPDQEPVRLTIMPGEESTKLFLGDSQEPVFEIEGCYTADGYMIDKATGDIYTCLEKVLPGYGDNS